MTLPAATYTWAPTAAPALVYGNRESFGVFSQDVLPAELVVIGVVEEKIVVALMDNGAAVGAATEVSRTIQDAGPPEALPKPATKTWPAPSAPIALADPLVLSWSAVDQAP